MKQEDEQRKKQRMKQECCRKIKKMKSKKITPEFLKSVQQILGKNNIFAPETFNPNFQQSLNSLASGFERISLSQNVPFDRLQHYTPSLGESEIKKQYMEQKYNRLFSENYKQTIQMFNEDIWEGSKPVSNKRQQMIGIEEEEPEETKRKKKQKDSSEIIPEKYCSSEDMEAIPEQDINLEAVFNCENLMETESLFDEIHKQLIFDMIDNRNQIENSQIYPHSCIGWITNKLQKMICFGTGFLIGPRIVLTCAHNLYDRESEQEYTDFAFLPGINGGKRKPCKVKKIYYPKEYKRDGQLNLMKYDFGIMVLEEGMSEKHGYLGIDTRANLREGTQDVEICGYPVDKETGTMWSAKGELCDKCKFDYLLVHKNATVDGQSGGPIIKKEEGREFVVGIHIGGDSRKKVNIGVRITKEVKRMINKWVKGMSGALNLNGQRLENEGIQYLAKKWSRKVSHLFLNDSNLNSRGLKLLSWGKWEELRELHLGKNQIDDEGIIFLHEFPFIKILHLENNKITWKGINLLSEGNFSSLKRLNLNGNSLGDQCLQFLPKITALEKLGLQATKMTDKALQYLWQFTFPSLNFVDLRSNGVGGREQIFERMRREKNIQIWLSDSSSQMIDQ